MQQEFKQISIQVRVKMLFIKKYFHSYLLILLLSTPLTTLYSQLSFEENKGQLPDEILYKAPLEFGDIYFKRNEINLRLIDMEGEHHMHHILEEIQEGKKFKGHAYNMKFIGSNTKTEIQADHVYSDYVNYFIGDNPDHWASEVKKYHEITYKELYPGIDVHFYQAEDHLKYDYILQAGADPKAIEVEYEGVSQMHLEEGALVLHLSNGVVKELKPIAFQEKNGKNQEIPCRYKLSGNSIRFEFPDGYDVSRELVIDPTLEFATFTGSTRDNWGFTATYDDLGQMYLGGTVFSNYFTFDTIYPTTIGAFDTDFNGGETDIGITVFEHDGSDLVYSTYIGGSGAEAPHSMIVNSNRELIFMGSSSSGAGISVNYPTTAGAYRTSHQGGVSQMMNGIAYTNGVDIVVTRLNSTGSSLLASTYVGGSGNDGISPQNGLNDYNYGDLARGEVYLDFDENIYVSSVSNSTNFPTTAGVYGPTHGGGVDGVVFKMPPSLNTMNWSTYVGGSGDEACYSLKIGKNNKVYTVGGTDSDDLTISIGSPPPATSGSTIWDGLDGFIISLESSNGSFSAGKYLGTANYDQAISVEIDSSGGVYVLGQSMGSYPVLGTGYSYTSGSQFIHKMDEALTDEFSTTFGNGTAQLNISPSAFMVDVCGRIYVAGWGGDDVISSSTNGLYASPGALKTVTDGYDFYFAQFDNDAKNITYATFFGGQRITGKDEHVDGGTSRFDRNGYIYQAICADCDGGGTFPSTPGVYADSNESWNCNAAGVKIKFDASPVYAQAQVAPSDFSCDIPFTVNFTSSSTNATSHYWDFGDGTNSTQMNPTKTYTAAGIYEVLYIATNPTSCNVHDTARLTIEVNPEIEVVDTVNTQSCSGSASGAIELWVGGGSPTFTYAWQHGPTTPVIVGLTAGTYTVTVTDSKGCTEIGQFDVIVGDSLDGTISKKDPSCSYLDDGEATANILGGTSPFDYLWSTSETTKAIGNLSPGVYSVTIVDSIGCSTQMSTVIDPTAALSASITASDVCLGDSVYAIAGSLGGLYYVWHDGSTNDTLLVKPSGDTTLTVIVSDSSCADTATVNISTLPAPEVTIEGPDLVCKNETEVVLTAVSATGTSFVWSNGATSNPIVVSPTDPGPYTVVATNAAGCKNAIASNSFTFTYDPDPEADFDTTTVLTSFEKIVDFMDQSIGAVSWHWDFGDGNTSTDQNPSNDYDISGDYEVTLIVESENGCIDTAKINVEVPERVIIPNVFTPGNGDGHNDVFIIQTLGLMEYELTIFNRWGMEIFRSGNSRLAWNGRTHSGDPVPSGTYYYLLKAKSPERIYDKVGYITLIREDGY